MNELDRVFNVGSVLAVFLAAIAIIIATRRRSKMTPTQLEAPQQRLEKRVTELENTVATLQNLLYEKQRQIDALQMEYNATLQRLSLLEAQGGTARPTRRQEVLLAVIGDDPALSIDMAALREVERRGTFRLSRLRPATKSELKIILDRYRVDGNPIKNIHMSVHAGPEGVAMVDGLATADWLSETLKSVDILFINGCRSDSIGDWIGVVGAVVTMREDVGHTDAAQFARLFWTGISDGLAAETAFDRAIARAPQGLAEFVELHL